MAKVVQPFDGVPDGQVHPRRFNVGDDVVGELAKVALAENWAVADEQEAPLAAVELRIAALLDRAWAFVAAAFARLRRWVSRHLTFTP
jgi:hypothetical protein